MEQTAVMEKPIEKKAKYKIVVDYGKPFDIDISDEAELHKELLRLQKEQHRELTENEQYPYFDIFIYQGEVDITDIVFFYFDMVAIEKEKL